MTRNIECKCTYNFTCGYCLRNAKPWVWTPTSAAERITLTQDADRRKAKEGKK